MQVLPTGTTLFTAHCAGLGTVCWTAPDGSFSVKPLGAAGCAVPVVPDCVPIVGLPPPSALGLAVRLPAGTLFGAYNAITGYYQNVRNFKDGDAKFKSIMDGTARQRAQVAFDLCGNFAKSGADALNLN